MKGRTWISIGAVAAGAVAGAIPEVWSDAGLHEAGERRKCRTYGALRFVRCVPRAYARG